MTIEQSQRRNSLYDIDRRHSLLMPNEQICTEDLILNCSDIWKSENDFLNVLAGSNFCNSNINDSSFLTENSKTVLDEALRANRDTLATSSFQKESQHLYPLFHCMSSPMHRRSSLSLADLLLNEYGQMTSDDFITQHQRRSSLMQETGVAPLSNDAFVDKHQFHLKKLRAFMEESNKTRAYILGDWSLSSPTDSHQGASRSISQSWKTRPMKKRRISKHKRTLRA